MNSPLFPCGENVRGSVATLRPEPSAASRIVGQRALRYNDAQDRPGRIPTNPVVGRGLLPAKECILLDQRMAAGGILNRTRKYKLEIFGKES
jgi:hypothetical protein